MLSDVPTGENSCSWSTRSSLTCMAGLMLPTSSRKSEPPSATRKRPREVLTAPVKAPRTCPKSSLSSRPSGSAPEFTLTKGCPALLLIRCIALATNSLPVPLSPVTSTVLSVLLTRLTRSTTAAIPTER